MRSCKSDGALGGDPSLEVLKCRFLTTMHVFHARASSHQASWRVQKRKLTLYTLTTSWLVNDGVVAVSVLGQLVPVGVRDVQVHLEVVVVVQTQSCQRLRDLQLEEPVKSPRHLQLSAQDGEIADMVLLSCDRYNGHGCVLL